jgi:hypothetical protein
MTHREHERLHAFRVAWVAIASVENAIRRGHIDRNLLAIGTQVRQSDASKTSGLSQS